MVVIGLDIGTTTICACVLNAQTGQILQTWTRPHGFLPASAPYEKCQSVAEIEQIVDELLLEITTRYSDIDCLGLTGQMHSIVYLDAANAPVSPLITWQDARGNERLGGSTRTCAEQLHALTGYPCATGYGLVTHYYNVQCGLVPPAAASFCTIHDYIFLRLCGLDHPVTHPSDAASMGLFDMAHGCFDHAALRRAGLDAALLPEVSSTCTARTRFGFPAAVPIGDNQACYHGAVRDAQHTILINVGTGSQISCCTSTCAAAPGMEPRPYVSGDFLLSGSSLCGGRAYALLEQFFRAFLHDAGHPDASAYETMNRLAAQYATLHDPLHTRTTFCGTRDDPTQRGAITNIGTENFTPAHLTVSVLQGCVDELYAHYEAMRPLLTAPPRALVGSGNGLRKNRALQALFERTFDLPMRIPVHLEEAATGAALFALLRTQPSRTPQSIRSLIRYEGE